MTSNLEAVKIYRSMYQSHPNREALAEQLGLTRQDVDELAADARSEHDRDEAEPLCGHHWGSHSVSGCEVRGCPCEARR